MRWNDEEKDSKRFEDGDFGTIKEKEEFYVPLK